MALRVLYRGKLSTLTPFVKFSCFTKFRPVIKACTIHCHNLLVPHFAAFCHLLPYGFLTLILSDFLCQYLPLNANVNFMQLFAAVCLSHILPIFANLCQSLPIFANLCQSLPIFANLCQSLPIFANLCQSLPLSDNLCHFMFVLLFAVLKLCFLLPIFAI